MSTLHPCAIITQQKLLTIGNALGIVVIGVPQLLCPKLKQRIDLLVGSLYEISFKRDHSGGFVAP